MRKTIIFLTIVFFLIIIYDAQAKKVRFRSRGGTPINK